MRSGAGSTDFSVVRGPFPSHTNSESLEPYQVASGCLGPEWGWLEPHQGPVRREATDVFHSPKALPVPAICPWHPTPLGSTPHPRHISPRDPYALTLTAGCQAEHLIGLWPLTCPGPADGVTHWSLTGSRDVDKDAFLSFSDGVSQSGTGPLLWVLGAGSRHWKGPSQPCPSQWSQPRWK